MDGTNVAGDDFDSVLRFLRSLATSCDPPVGVGAFDILYASDKEVVVWYSPARQEHTPGEVTIPSARLAAAWAALTAGDPLDEAALESLGAGPAGGRWLLALLVQVPGVRLREDALSLTWAPGEAPVPALVDAPIGIVSPVKSGPKPKTSRSHRRKPRATRP